MRLYTSEKEAVALIVAIEAFIRSYPDSTAALKLQMVVERIRACLNLQGKV